MVEKYISEEIFNKLDRYFDNLEKSDIAMGVLSICHKGDKKYNKATGFSLVNKKIKNSDRTIFKIGSISKTFTAILIIKLIEENRLTLDSKLKEFFPNLINSDKITIEQLLNHSSGICNYTEVLDFFMWVQRKKTKDDVIERIRVLGSNFDPGEKHAYSNSGYFLLGLIAEKVSNRSYKELLEEYIIEPLNLENTFVLEDIENKKNMAKSYVKAIEWEETITWDNISAFGCAGVISTPDDINRFYFNLFNGKIVAEKSMEKILPKGNKYGYGIFKEDFLDFEVYGHSGAIDIFRAMSYYLPKLEIGITYITNGFQIDFDKILYDIRSIIFENAEILPSLKESVRYEIEEIDEISGLYSSNENQLELKIAFNSGKFLFEFSGIGIIGVESFYKNRYENPSVDLYAEFFPEKKSIRINSIFGNFEYKKKLVDKRK